MVKYYNVEPLVNLLADKDPLESVNVGAVLQALQHGLYNGEVRPVIHAHWIWEDKWTENSDFCTCSNCNEHVIQYVTALQMDKQLWEGKAYWSYCPHCGAKMDEKEGNL